MIKSMAGVLLAFTFASQAATPLDIFAPDLLPRIESKYGEQASIRVEFWQQLIYSNQDRTEKEKLELVNRFFNQIKFADDMDIWNEKDRWSTPIEFISRNAGDSEDFNMAKYFTLRALGVPANKLRIMYVNSIALKESHKVLTYYEQPNSMPMILDNVNKNILAGNERTDLIPIYSFKAHDLWVAIQRKKGREINHHVDEWKEVINSI